MLNRFIDCHNHTDMSNLRLLDAICTLDGLAKRAEELGLKGVCFTEHECLSNSIKICEMREKYPNLKFGIGNEIYLTQTRDKNQKYYHFLLIAKDLEGHRQLRELSSRAWMQSYYDRGMERVPTLMSELEEVIKKNPGHLIATSACLGGQLSVDVLAMEKARKIGDKHTELSSYNDIVSFVQKMKDLFGQDFYVELPPGTSEDQVIANKKLYQIAHLYNIKIETSCDSHYIHREDRYIHKSFLNSKGGEREVDSFYEFTYLQSSEEIVEHLKASFGEFAEQIYNECVIASEEIYNKIEEYDLRHNQTIPTVEVPKTIPYVDNSLKDYPNLYSLRKSNNDIERYWIDECLKSLKKKEFEGKIAAKDTSKYLNELEKEADIKRTVGDRLGTNIFAYPIVLKHYIDMMWECGSTIGAGRGSAGAGLNHWLLGITQYDPIKLNLPFERYMNWDTAGLPDIDFDVCGSKRPLIIQKVKEEREKNFRQDIDDLSRKNLGCTLVATFGTASTKKAIQIACSGYRNEDYPNGIDVDTSQYLSSLIPQERGFVWSLHDTVYGNEEKGRAPQTTFINEVNQFPGLLDIMFGVEGLVVSRGSHASGVILFDEDPYEFSCFMRTPKGDVITQYDLEDAEAAGMTKYDWLITAVQDKIAETIRLLQEHGEINKNLTLREVYEKYLSPEVLDFEDKAVWDAINKGNILDLFQFDSQIGSQGIKKVHPDTLNDLSNTNGVIRLMAEEGKEPPLDKFVRYKNNINLWYDEMEKTGLTQNEMKIMEKYMLKSHGIAISQECIMWSLQDKDICGFSLKEANKARKIISKKKMDQLPKLKQSVFERAKTPEIGRYEWEYVILPSAGYGFSDIHSIFYSMIGFQTAYLTVKWNPIYWNTACLIVNSGSLEEDSTDNYDEETGEIAKKESTTDYKKLATALGKIIQQGIKVSLVDINRSNYGFEPDVENNQILFGMKALSNVGAPIIEKIMENRPYHSLKEFMRKCPLNKTAMISLIKSGAFDNLESAWAKEFHVDPRIVAMTYYLSKACDPKSKLTLQNFNGLIEKEIVPDSLEQQKQAFIFNKYLKKHKKGLYYLMTNQDVSDVVTRKLIDTDDLEIIQGIPCIKQKTWDKNYQVIMDLARDWLKDNQAAALKEYNTILFKEAWDKYASGNISSWEMEALCFYYHDHELKTIDNNRYGIVDFNELSTEPIVDRTFKRNGKQIPLYKLYKIAGTVISKNDSRHSISLLTTTGVVNVKFTKEYYALYGRQLSEIQPDGTKKVREKGWFVRGTKLLITGFRRDDTFVSKNYKSNGGHQLYKINAVNGSRMEITHTRYGQSEEN